MTTCTLRLSPAAFDLLSRELMAAELRGHRPDTATRWACARIGYWPKAGTTTVLVVDPALSQPHAEVSAEPRS